MLISIARPLALAAAELDLAGELSFARLLALSGFVGWLIVACALLALALAIHSYLALAREALAPSAQIERLQRLFDAGELERALELCDDEPTFLGRVVAAGLGKLGHPFEVIQTALEERGDDEAVRLHHNIGWLSVLATVAPMLGVAGTVWGMIQSFHVLASSDNATPAQLASGVYVALLTTLEGLAVAIPALVAFAYLRNRLVRSMLEIGAVVEDLFERFRPGNQGAPR